MAMSTVLSTDAVAPRDRAPQWREWVSRHFGGLESDLYGDSSFDGHMASTVAGDVILTKLEANRHRVLRTPQMARTTETAYLKIVAPWQGSAEVQQQGREACTRAGNWVIYDTTGSYAIANPEHVEHLIVMLPKEQMVERGVKLDELMARQVGAARGISRVALDTMRSTWQELPNMSEDAARGAGELIMQLVRLSLLELAGQATAVTQREALKDRILTYVARNLRDPQLSIDRSAPQLKRRRRRWPWIVAALALAAGAALLWMPRKLEVQASAVLAAYPSQQLADLTASGYVVAQRRAAVASKGTGRLVELSVREGSVVKQGALIGRLDASDVQAGIAAAEAGVAQARAARAQAEAAVGQARAELANAEVELKRQQDLRAQGFVSPQAVDGAQRRLDVARSALATAQAAVASAQAGVVQSQAQVKVQQVNQANTDIRAPFDGVVLVKNANVGDMITPFSSASGTSGAVVTMADMTTLEVEADVSESNVARIKPDQPVEITLDALPDMRFRGSVSRVVPTVDRAKATVMTKVRFERLDPRILPEMSAKVSFLSRPASAEDQKAVVAVNPKAITERDGARLVFRLNGDTVEAVPVTPGRRLGDVQELLQPALKSGERVVLNPPPTLKSGAKVTVVAK